MSKSGVDHLFCPRSGQLVDINLEKGVMECQSSGFSKPLRDLADVKIVREVDMEDYLRRYNLKPLVQSQALDAGKKILQRDDNMQCPKCSTMGIEFYTKQLRSADEGQTIFYECPECSGCDHVIQTCRG